MPGERNPEAAAAVDKRCKALFRKQLSGLPARQLVLSHAAEEGISEATAWRDWKTVCAWNDSGWSDERDSMLARIQTMRLALIDKATRKGQLQTAMMGLKDLQETLLLNSDGEESTVKLNINIEAAEARIKNALPQEG